MLPNKFQVSWPRRPSRISDRNDFKLFTPMLPTESQVSWPFGSGDAAKNWFPRRTLTGHNSSPWTLRATSLQCFLPSLKSIGLSVQEMKRNTDFLNWPPRRPSWISGRNELFLIYKSPQCFLPSFKSIGLPNQEKKRKIDVRNGRQGGQLGFPIGTILAPYDLHITTMLLTVSQVNWPYGSGEEV